MSELETSTSSATPTLNYFKNERDINVLCTLFSGNAKYKYPGRCKNIRIDDISRPLLEQWQSYITGIEYDGNWLNGRENGFGKMKFDNGQTYEGEWNDGVMDGHGKMTGGSSPSFEGTWHNGMKNGSITIEWLNGRIFKGQYVNGGIPLEIADGKPNIVEMRYPQPDGSAKYYNGPMYQDFSWDEYKQPETSFVQKAKSFLKSRKPTTAADADGGVEMKPLPLPLDDESGGSNSRMKRRQSKQRRQKSKRRQSKRH